MVTYCCYFKYRGAISGSSQGARTSASKYGECVETLGGVKAQSFTWE